METTGAESGILGDGVIESTELGGQNRLELTRLVETISLSLAQYSPPASRRFTEKSDWIDEKIQLLNSLPPVDAFSPLPPDISSTDRAQLSIWYQEFAQIEQQVDDYDMGDLSSLRRFAAS